MAALFEDHRCPVCGEPHHFYLPEADAADERRRYEFVCPEKGQPGVFATALWSQVARAKPPGAVVLKRSDLPL